MSEKPDAVVTELPEQKQAPLHLSTEGRVPPVQDRRPHWRWSDLGAATLSCTAR